MGRVTETVKVIIIINILFFVGSLITNSSDLFAVWYPENPNYGAWQILTHMFMHSQTFYLHIIFNMLGVWMFGSPLEQMWGRNKFLFFYVRFVFGGGGEGWCSRIGTNAIGDLVKRNLIRCNLSRE